MYKQGEIRLCPSAFLATVCEKHVDSNICLLRARPTFKAWEMLSALSLSSFDNSLFRLHGRALFQKQHSDRIADAIAYAMTVPRKQDLLHGNK